MRLLAGRCIPASLVTVLALILVNILLVYRSGSRDCDETMQLAYREISDLEKQVEELQVALREAKQIIDESHQQQADYEVQKQQQPQQNRANLPTIFMITPTYSRWTQKADLTRLCQTLMHVKNLHWIVVEDADLKTNLVSRFLKKCPVHSTHMNIRTPPDLRLSGKEPKWRKSRGVEQRNLGLQWLRETQPNESGVVYFGDDDNTYGLELFDEMRFTKLMSVWPVGICGGLRWEGPVCENGRVTAWHTAWALERPFPIDFAAFSLSLSLILKHRQVTINPYSKIGRVESDFLSQLVTQADVEAKADNCMKVYVWHTRTEKPKTKDEEKLIALGKPSNLLIET